MYPNPKNHTNGGAEVIRGDFPKVGLDVLVGWKPAIFQLRSAHF